MNLQENRLDVFTKNWMNVFIGRRVHYWDEEPLVSSPEMQLSRVRLAEEWKCCRRVLLVPVLDGPPNLTTGSDWPGWMVVWRSRSGRPVATCAGPRSPQQHTSHRDQDPESGLELTRTRTLDPLCEERSAEVRFSSSSSSNYWSSGAY